MGRFNKNCQRHDKVCDGRGMWLAFFRAVSPADERDFSTLFSTRLHGSIGLWDGTLTHAGMGNQPTGLG